MKNECAHIETTIVVLDGFAMFEKIGYQCTECKEIIKTENK